MKDYTILYKLLQNKSMSPQIASYLKMILDSNYSGLIVGDTKLGRTDILHSMIDLKKKPCNLSMVENVSELQKSIKNIKIIDRKIRENISNLSKTILSMGNESDMLLLKEFRLGKYDTRDLKSVLKSGHLVVCAMNAADEKQAVSQLVFDGMLNYWKWIAVVRESKNSSYYRLDSVWEIVSGSDCIMIPICRFGEDISCDTISEHTHHLTKSHQFVNNTHLKDTLSALRGIIKSL